MVDRLSKVVDVFERKHTLMECDRMKENFATAIDLIRKLKFLSLTDRNAHWKSFNYFIMKGYIEKAQWEIIKQLAEYLYTRISNLHTTYFHFHFIMDHK